MRKDEAVVLTDIHSALLEVSDKLGRLLLKQAAPTRILEISAAEVADAVEAMPDVAPALAALAPDADEEKRVTKVNDQLEGLGIKFKFGGTIDFDWDAFVEGIGADNAKALRDILVEKYGES